jgi:hypothetical protein
MELFDYWVEHPPAHIALAQISIWLGAREAPGTEGSTDPEQIAAMIANPKQFGGQVRPISDLPDWMKTSLAMAGL